MVADTKKRGRPAKHSAVYDVFPDKEPRAAANLHYAMKFAIEVMHETPDTSGNFFITSRGNIRRQGIAEQLGRMYGAALITADEARELMVKIRHDYEQGRTVKQITKDLATVRKALQNEREADARNAEA